MESLEILGNIILVGGGASVIAYALIKWFGEKWFEHQFAQRLESFKREQSEILEHYRFQINSRFNRITKIHEKEFEVLPKAWQMLQETYDHLVAISSPLQQWPDLNRYNSDQLESFLENCELNESEKTELRDADDKMEYYKDKAYWRRLHVAGKKFHDFRIFLRDNKIFLSRDLFEYFSKIESLIIRVEVELENPEEEPWKSTRETHKKLTNQIKEIFPRIEEAVQKRLQFEDS
jgi:hypothetical protein